jgi:hypothetical protein
MAMERFRAPPLPVPPNNYDQQYATQLIRVLGLYFTQLDSLTPQQANSYRADNFYGGLFNGYGGGLILPYIGASDSTEQYATANNTPTIVNFNTLDAGYGFTLNAPNVAVAEFDGIYKIDYSAQLANSANAPHDAVFWLRVNGVDVPNSATTFTLIARKSAGNPSYLGVYSTVVFEVNAGDQIALYWATDQARILSPATDGIYIHQEPVQTSPYAHPAIPSMIGAISFMSALP